MKVFLLVKAVCILTIITMLLPGVCFAEEAAITAAANYDLDTRKVTVTGVYSGGEGKFLTLLAVPADMDPNQLDRLNESERNENIVAWGQFMSQQNGGYSYTFSIQKGHKTSKYLVYVNDANGNAAAAMFLHADEEVAQAVLYNINAIAGKADPNNVSDVYAKEISDLLDMEENQIALILDVTEFAGFRPADKISVGKLLIQMKPVGGYTTAAEFSRYFKKAVAVVGISAGDANTIEQLIIKYGSTCGLNMAGYNGLQEDAKEWVTLVLEKGQFNSAASLSGEFDHALILAHIARPESASDIKTTMSVHYASTLSQSTAYTGLKDKDGVYNRMMVAGVSAYSDADVAAAFNQAVNEQSAYENSQSSKDSDSTGGGGKKTTVGSGAFIPSILPAVNPSDAELDSVPWAKASILKLKESGILSGDDSGMRPFDSVTRGEFTKMLVNALKLEETDVTADFADVSFDSWEYPYVARAVKHGIVNGTGEGLFGTGLSIKREDMAVMIARALEASGATLNTGSGSTFSDDGEIAEYALQSVESLYELGIIKGNGDGTYSPKSNTTRAQAAVIIDRVMQMLASVNQ